MVANTEVGSTSKGNKFRRLCSENKIVALSIFLIVLGIVVGLLLLLAIPAILKKAERPYRLPTDISPYHYDLEIQAYLSPHDFKFDGKVAIFVNCYKKTDSIVFHSSGLEIVEKSVKVSCIDKSEDIEVLLVDYDHSNDLLILRLLEDLKERSTYRISMEYKGMLKEDMNGFYVSSYKDEQNLTHYIASTHFEPVHAREAFPCFDEPQLKSTFNITLVRWDNTVTLSNMQKLQTEYRGRHWKADIYEKSMKMSTYLVAFVFCDYVENSKGRVSVWAPENRRNNTELALDVAIKTLGFLEDKLGIQYLGPKIDMVPVPILGAAAMENWGLIIYQEDFLLTPEDKDYETARTISMITETVAHEVSHQWFGNLVTMKWWSDLWLNEGITSYMENLVFVHILPNWHKVDSTVANMLPLVEYDCEDSKPIWRPVRNSKDALEAFEGMTYEKGAMTTRMAHHILGEEVFWKGIARYLHANSYDNVDESDFWRYLTAAQASNKDRLDMEKIMDPWTHLSGLPIVTAHRDYNRKSVIISQHTCKSQEKEHENDIWNIPMIFVTKHSDNLFREIKWLKTRNTTVKGMPGDHEWIAINTKMMGYYLVNYDRRNWELLNQQLISSHTIFHPTERYKLLFDIMELGRMDYVDIDMVFQQFIYVRNEGEAEVLTEQIDFLRSFVYFFDEEKYNDLMKEFVFHVWKKLYDKYGWANEGDNRKLLTMTELMVSDRITEILCRLGYGPCVQEALRRFDVMEKSENKTEMTRGNDFLAMCAALGNATFEDLPRFSEYLEKFPENLSSILKCANDPAIIQAELAAAKGTEIPIFFLLVVEQSDRKIAFDECLKFADENFDDVEETDLEMWDFSTWHMKHYGSITRINKIKQLLTKHLKSTSGPKAEKMEKALEFINENVPRWEKRARNLKKWLDRKPWKTA